MARIEETAALEAQDSRPSHDLDDATSRLIREQVRAVMREEFSPVAPVVPEHNGNPPPSYDSAADANTSRRAPDEIHSEAARLLGEHLPAADDGPSTQPPRRQHTAMARGFRSLPGLMRFLIIFTPFAAVFVLVPVLCTHGDVLGVSAVAFLLLLANLFAFGFAITTAAIVAGFDEPGVVQTPQEKSRSNEAGGLGFTLYFLIAWAAFAFIMWKSFASGDGSLLPRYLLAGRFDAKITQHRALEFVTGCIEEMIPHRNATIDDFTFCFKKFGMPQTIIS